MMKRLYSNKQQYFPDSQHRMYLSYYLKMMKTTKKYDRCIDVITSTSGTRWFSSYGSMKREAMANPMKTRAPMRVTIRTEIFLAIRAPQITATGIIRTG